MATSGSDSDRPGRKSSLSPLCRAALLLTALAAVASGCGPYRVVPGPLVPFGVAEGGRLPGRVAIDLTGLRHVRAAGGNTSPSGIWLYYETDCTTALRKSLLNFAEAYFEKAGPTAADRDTDYDYLLRPEFPEPSFRCSPDGTKVFTIKATGKLFSREGGLLHAAEVVGTGRQDAKAHGWPYAAQHRFAAEQAIADVLNRLFSEMHSSGTVRQYAQRLRTGGPRKKTPR